MQYFAAFITALVVTMALMPPLIRYSGKLGLVDEPNARKVHAASIPRIGGVGMVLGMLVPALLWLPLEREVVSILAALIVLFVFGVWDDRGDMDYRLKFLGQFVAALVVVVYGNVIIDVLPFFGLDPVSKWFAIPFTTVVIVAVTNAVNLSDGLDGLAGGIITLSLSGVAILAYISDATIVLLLSLIVMGSIAGFLRFNTYPARIFMGDTGSQYLGFSSVVLVIILTQDANPALNPAIPLLLLGLPLFDTIFVVSKRIYSGKSPFSPDKNHVHHQLLALGLDHYEAVVIIYAVHALFVLGGVVFRYQTDLFVVLLWLATFCVLAAVLVMAGHHGWRAHNEGAGSVISGWFAERNIRYSARVADAVIHYGVPLPLILGPFLASSVSPDFGIAAMLLFVLLLLRLILGYKVWFIYLRLLMFVAMAFTLYLLHVHPSEVVTLPVFVDYVFYGLLATALVVSARSTVTAAFQVTPTDYLIVIVIIGMVILSQVHVGEFDLTPLIIKIVIMFYAIEIILRKMTSRVCGMTLASLWAFGVIAYRGLV